MRIIEQYACELRPGDTILRHGHKFWVVSFRNEPKEASADEEWSPTLDEGYVEIIVTPEKERHDPYRSLFRLVFEELTPMERVVYWPERLIGWLRRRPYMEGG